jgi:uncharacterized protein (TIGR01777 family)
MKIAVTGASGLIGTALVADLRRDGHEVLRLVRRPVRAPDEVRWDPEHGRLAPADLAGTDAAVNLAGAGIGDRRWTPAYQRVLYDSHVGSARTIATALAAAHPRPRVLVSVGAMGYYGNDTGGRPLTEDDPPGTDFAATVVRDKEAATQGAADDGVRVCLPRLALVMDRSGGTVGRRMLPLCKVGLLGPLAGGGTVWSVVSLPDVVRAIRYLLADESAAGPYNVSAPQPTTNAEFTRLLGKAMSRPTVLPVPRFGMKLVLSGQLADNVLASFSVVPRRLLDAGFRFEHPDAAAVVRAALGR